MASVMLSRLLGTLKSTFRVNKATIDASMLSLPRTVTLPDASLTVAGVNVPQKFTALQTFAYGSAAFEKMDEGGITYLVIQQSQSNEHGTDRSIYVYTGDANRTIFLNDDVTLPQIIPAAGPTLGQTIALARQIVRY